MTKKYLLKLFLLLAVLEGIPALFWLFRNPSAAHRAGLFGFSTLRLVFGLAVLAPLAGFTILTLLSFTRPARSDAAIARLDELLLPGKRLLVISLASSFTFLLGLAILLVWSLPVIHEYGWYSTVFGHNLHKYEAFLTVFDHALPIFVWGVALIGQASLALVAGYRQTFRQAGFFDWRVIYSTLLALLGITLSLGQWFILAMQMNVFTSIPSWYWIFIDKPFSVRDILLPILLVLGILGATYTLRAGGQIWRKLALLFVLGVAFQIGFGIMDGQGFESLRVKYADSKHRSYAITASQDDLGMLQVVREYEQRFGDRMFPGTKPPGVILTYMLVEKAVNAFNPQPTTDARFLALTTFMAYVFPFIAFLTVPLLFYFMRRYTPLSGAYLPSIFYLLLPNILLIPLFLDQVWYPLLFLLGVWLSVLAVERRSFLLALLCGLYIYIAIFQTFSMLPLIPFFFIALALEWLRDWRGWRLVQPMKLGVGLGVGILALFITLRFTLNYDVLVRYQGAIRGVRNHDFAARVGKPLAQDLANQTLQPGAQQVLQAMFYNNVEYAAAVGFPLYLLFLSGAIRSALAFIKRKATRRDVALGGMAATFLALNLYAPMQGEVTRLWMFWAPMIVLLAGAEFLELYGRKNWIVYSLIAMQLITVYLTFQFQDFIV